MPKYRRYFGIGNCYFLTLVTREREKIFNDAAAIAWFKESLHACKPRYPFSTLAIVLLPNHIHMILEMKNNRTPADLIRCVKRGFLYRIKLADPEGESLLGKLIKPSGTVWQKRYYDHVIRDLEDFSRHCDYVHYNPVKHGWVNDPFQWTYSCIHRYAYKSGWGKEEPKSVAEMNLE